MMSRWLSLFLLLAIAPLWAQMAGTYHSRATLRVDVILSTGGHAPPHLRVQLRQGTNGTLAAMDQTNSSGNVEFQELDPGDYDVLVTGDGIQPGDSGGFNIPETRDFMSVTVVVKPTAEAEPGAEMRGSSVAAADLNVPKKASKEYDRAEEEMAQNDWDKAIDHLNKAIAIYPQYSAAYNDLGVCYGRLKQEDKQREALLKAISVNDHCIPALVNLAHMEMKDNHLLDAVESLNKAIQTDPTNVEALSLLTQVEYMQGHYDQAIIDAHKVHGLAHHYSIVHYTAASALQKENRIPEAIVELEVFLQEEPQGPRADAVRRVLGAMQNGQSALQSQPQSPPHDKGGGAGSDAGGGVR